MIKPGTLDLIAYRNTPFKRTVDFVGYDFTGDTSAKMEVRITRAAAGAALISLTIQTPGTQGLSWAVATVDGVVTSTLTIDITEASIDACLPASSNGQKIGTDVVLQHDFISAGAGVGKVRWHQGSFTIAEGATV